MSSTLSRLFDVRGEGKKGIEVNPQNLRELGQREKTVTKRDLGMVFVFMGGWREEGDGRFLVGDVEVQISGPGVNDVEILR